MLFERLIRVHAKSISLLLIFKARIAVLRQNSMSTENSAIPCRDGCPIQVIPQPSSAKNLSRGTSSGIPAYIKDGGTRTFSRRYLGSD
jgi:hypothetical protein